MTPKQFIPRTMKGTARSYADNPGKLFHGVLPGNHVAICGTRPGQTSAGWDNFVGKRVTCPKCLKRLALLPSDPTDDDTLILAEIGRCVAAESVYMRGGQVVMADVITRAVSAIARETLNRREIPQPTPDQRRAVLCEVEQAVQRVVTTQLQREGGGEGQADSADAAPFPVFIGY